VFIRRGEFTEPEVFTTELLLQLTNKSTAAGESTQEHPDKKLQEHQASTSSTPVYGTPPSDDFYQDQELNERAIAEYLNSLQKNGNHDKSQ